LLIAARFACISLLSAGHVALSAHEAVSAVQQITADVISYMLEMGVDPALLQLSLKYESNDIRYLSRSEMEQYRVTTHHMDAGQPQVLLPTPSPPAPPQPNIAVLPQPSIRNDLPVSIPEARSGRIRHPKGAAPMKALPDGKSANLINLRNGTSVSILSDATRAIGWKVFSSRFNHAKQARLFAERGAQETDARH
jgi:hypothetical protein